MRENPISKNMKPSCMSITKTAATITQTVSTALATSVTFTRSPLFDWTGGPTHGRVASTVGPVLGPQAKGWARPFGPLSNRGRGIPAVGGGPSDYGVD